MQDDMKQLAGAPQRLDPRVLRHMMHETIDLLDRSTDHADEACMNTDAAMALTRIDWMLMAIFNWLTEQLRGELNGAGHKALGDPISIVGINQKALSKEMRSYAQAVDRLHDRIGKLDSLLTGEAEALIEATEPRPTARILNIFGDPTPGAKMQNPVLSSRQRLSSAFGGA